VVIVLIFLYLYHLFHIVTYTNNVSSKQKKNEFIELYRGSLKFERWNVYNIGNILSKICYTV